MPRVDFGNLELEIQPVSPFEILDEIKHQMTPLAKNKGLEFIIDCVGRLPEFINTDARRLRQIMSSLVNHAIKYTENGRVVVRPPAPSGRSRRCIGAGCDDVAEKPINRPLLFKMIQRLAQPGKAEVTEPIPQPAIDLTELQRDMLGEFLNMGLGNAADALSIMTGGEVELSIPKVEFVTPVELRERFTRLLGSELSIVQQRFTGSLEGEAFLLFSSSMVLEFVRSCAPEALPLDLSAELERDVLSEVGNIILNAFMSVFSDQLGMDLEPHIPRVQHIPARELMAGAGKNEDSKVMLSAIDFGVMDNSPKGYLGLHLEPEACKSMIEHLDRHLESRGLC